MTIPKGLNMNNLILPDYYLNYRSNLHIRLENSAENLR